MATPPSPPGGPDNGNADNHGQGHGQPGQGSGGAGPQPKGPRTPGPEQTQQPGPQNSGAQQPGPQQPSPQPGVCLYPIHVMGECYVNSSDDSSDVTLESYSLTAQLVRDTNDILEPVDCGSAAIAPDDLVIQMLGESQGLEGADCPPETEYLLSDNRGNVSSCYVEAGA